MKPALRVIQAIAVNAVTAFGVFGARWTIATAILLYWSENVISIALIAVRFVLHRAATHKRGHQRGVLKNFLLPATVFTAAHGLFLAFFLLLLFPKIAPQEALNVQEFKLGLGLITAMLGAGFVIDLVDLKNMPFASLRALVDGYMPRILVVHLTIIFGMFAMAVVKSPRALFAVFVLLKTGVDVMARASTQDRVSDTPPPWILALANNSGDAAKVTETWKRDREAAMATAVDDELPA